MKFYTELGTSFSNLGSHDFAYFEFILCVLALGGFPCLHLLCKWLAAPFSKIHPPFFYEKEAA